MKKKHSSNQRLLSLFSYAEELSVAKALPARGAKRTLWIIPRGRRRRQCMDHCPNRSTHYGVAHSVAHMSGCEFHVRMWVQDCDHLAFFPLEFQEKIHAMRQDKALRGSK